MPSPFFIPTGEDSDSTIRKVQESELWRRIEELEPGQKLEVFEGERTWLSEPKHTIVKKAGSIEFYDGPSGFFNTPTRVIETKQNTDCFVATAVYGDINAPQVQVLRGFRDNVLSKNYMGRAFVRFYYAGAGKKLADFLQGHLPSTVPAIRRGLNILVEMYSWVRKAQ
jgi:hypothetical protein